MERREVIKCLSVLVATAFLPGVTISNSKTKPSLHFVGLGSCGANVANHCHEKGIPGKYTGITWYPSFIEPYKALNHIQYVFPCEFRGNNKQAKKHMPLSEEMKSDLSSDSFFVVFCGLGGYTGTSLISDTLEFLEVEKKSYLAICTLPLKSEGKYRNNHAQFKMKELEKYNGVRYVDNNEIFHKIGTGGGTSIKKILNESDEEMFRIFEEDRANFYA